MKSNQKRGFKSIQIHYRRKKSTIAEGIHNRCWCSSTIAERNRCWCSSTITERNREIQMVKEIGTCDRAAAAGEKNGALDLTMAKGMSPSDLKKEAKKEEIEVKDRTCSDDYENVKGDRGRGIATGRERLDREEDGGLVAVSFTGILGRGEEKRTSEHPHGETTINDIAPAAAQLVAVADNHCRHKRTGEESGSGR
ncbi:hypothetical protein LXL04_000262 [Taraxacum kok-saghyz]